MSTDRNTANNKDIDRSPRTLPEQATDSLKDEGGRFKRYWKSVTLGGVTMGVAKIAGQALGIQLAVSAGAAMYSGAKGYNEHFNERARLAEEQEVAGPEKIFKFNFQKATEALKNEKGIRNSLSKSFNEIADFGNFDKEGRKVYAKKFAMTGAGALGVVGVTELAETGLFDGVINFFKDLWDGLDFSFWSSEAEPATDSSNDVSTTADTTVEETHESQEATTGLEPELDLSADADAETTLAAPEETDIDTEADAEAEAEVEAEENIALEDMSAGDAFNTLYDEMLSTLDVDKLSITAQDDLIAAQAGDLESIQNIAYYIANDLEGFETFNADSGMNRYAVAMPFAEIGADNENLNAIKFLAQMDSMGFDVNPAHAESYEAITGEPVQLEHDALLNSADCRITGDFNAFSIDCQGASSKLLASGDSLNLNVNGHYQSVPYTGESEAAVGSLIRNVSARFQDGTLAFNNDNASSTEQYALVR